MGHLLFIATTLPGTQALASARANGHRTTLLWSRQHDFFLAPDLRDQALRLVDLAIEVDDLTDITVIKRGLAVSKVTDIDAVLTVFQLCVTQAAYLAAEFKARGPSVRGVNAAKDKAVCREILDQRGIPNLTYQTVLTCDEALAAAQEIGYPVVIKPVTGTAKLATTIAKRADDIIGHFTRMNTKRTTMAPALIDEIGDRFIVEQFAVGSLYSVEVASDGRSTVPLAAIRRKVGRDNPLLELGSTMPSGLAPQEEEELGQYCVQVCEALGLDLGIFHVEAIATAEGFRLIEVNPRIGGGMVPDVIRAATDVNLFELLVNLYAGDPVPGGSLSAKRGATNFFLGAAQPKAVRADLPDDWFESFRDRLERGNSNIRASMQLRAMEGNLDRYGTIQVTASNSVQAEKDCADIAVEMESVLGFPFVVQAPDSIDAVLRELAQDTTPRTDA